jgi:hypothetical protein
LVGDGGRFVDVTEAYAAGHVLDPDTQVAAYAAATTAALAAGYSGLRVAADITQLVRTPQQLDAFARYEFAIDRLALTTPFRAVCGFDRGQLGDTAIAELACMHPRSRDGATLFHLYPATPDADEIHLDGEVDTDLFATALRRARPGLPGRAILVHGEALRFIDHRGLLALQRYAELHGTEVLVRTPFSPARRLVDLLGIDRVRVEVIA